MHKYIDRCLIAQYIRVVPEKCLAFPLLHFFPNYIDSLQLLQYEFNHANACAGL